MLAGKAGRSIIPNLPPGNLVTSKATRCLYFAPVPFLVEDGSPVRLRRSVETLRRSSKSGVNNSVFDCLFLRPSTLTLLGTGGKHMPRTSSGGQSRDIITKIFGDRPQKIAAPPAKDKNSGSRLSLSA